MTKKSIRCMAIVLVMVMLFSTVAFATPATNFVTTETHYRSSYDMTNSIDYKIDGTKLTVSGIITIKNLDHVLVLFGEEKLDVATESGEMFYKEIDLTTAPMGPTAVDVYFHVQGDEMYRSYIYDFMYVLYNGTSWVFCESPVKAHNVEFNNAFIKPANYTDKSGIDASVISMSNEIVGSETNAYEKVRLLHTWVADNLYYDIPYAMDAVLTTPTTAKEVLEKRYGVCEGYANLLTELIRAQGIPAARVETLSIDEEINNIPSKTFAAHPDYMKNVKYPNHVYVEAYVDGRWVRMDPTWDCVNTYVNGTFTNGGEHGTHYFDVITEMFSLRQMIHNRGDEKVFRKEGKIVGEDVLFKDVKQSSWYYAAVTDMGMRGVVNGVGNDMFAPESPITYAQFCTIVARSTGLATGTQNGYWAYESVRDCLSNGYIETQGDITTENYDVPMPREAAVAAMARIYKNRLTINQRAMTSADIPDYGSISDIYKADIIDAYNCYITNGVDSYNTFSPSSILNRAQICQLFYNIFPNVVA